MTTATFKFTVMADPSRAETVAEALSELEHPAPDAVSWSEAADGDWRVEAYFGKRPDPAALRAKLLAAIGTDGPLPPGELEELAPRDWVVETQRNLHPVRAGRFLVHGSHDRERARGRSHAIEIEAGQAFGTAHHGSTRGCLLALDGLLKRRRFDRVLDIGTGTGVLAIAAATAQGKPVLACDIDPVAVEIARENARLNRVAALVTVVQSADARHPAIRNAAPFDLVLANILARPLARLAPRVSRLTASGGLVVLSGVTIDQHAALAARYRDAGFALLRRLHLEDWATLVLGRRR